MLLFALWVFGILGEGGGGILPGATLLGAAAVVAALQARQRARDKALAKQAFLLMAADSAACFLADAEGQVVLRNPAAESAFGTETRTLLGALGDFTLDPGAVLLKLQKQAEVVGAARQDLAIHQGVVRLSVHQADQSLYLWRIDRFEADSSAVPAAPRSDHAPQASMTGDLEDVPVPLMHFGPDGVLRCANRAARELLWQGELKAGMFHDIFEGLGRPVSDWLADVASGRLTASAEVLRLRHKGDEAFVQVTLRRYDSGDRPGVMAILNDATKLKTLEAQFAQSQKMQAIGQLAGGIAHDFNNLLTAIAGHCDLLLLRHGQEDPDFADLEQIRQNANRAAALVGQLLAFSRKQTLKPERIDLEDVLSDLTHLLNRLVVERVGLRLSHLGQGGVRALRPIRADRRQLEQVLINLVVNARDAMPNGGSVTIETEPVTLVEDLKRDRASVPAGDYSVIRVIDTGSGIQPENMQKIFEPFFTTKRVGEGTGLGLSMVYGIVKQSGGFVFVDSVLGEGTTFTLYFPVFEGSDPRQAVTETPRRKSVQQGDGVILLVEDEAPVRAFASRALQLRGYTVLEAATAEEALTLLEDSAIKVDVFVTDVVMPGLDGPSWVRKALDKRPNVKVIFMSGYAEDSLSEDQSRIPNSVFLPKPFSLNDLTETVQSQFQ
ncbi:MAG: ATP-binding protein [Tabrizicola sp.]|jgi:two-component system cell cycle sensor histidine kinase/response regulator CckA|nr:ATP-binding protein [Tabrizicola sp.]